MMVWTLEDLAAGLVGFGGIVLCVEYMRREDSLV